MIFAVIDTNVLVSARITKNSSSATVKVLNNMFNGTIGSRGFVTDGAARAEIKLAYSLPSRDGGRQLVNPRVI